MARAAWVASFAIGLVVACATVVPPPTRQSSLLENTMPAFEARTLSGNSIYSGAYEGRTLVVSFVASECAPCERTLAAAQAMYSDRHDIVVIGVFDEADADAAMNVVRLRGLRFPVVIDQGGVIAKRFALEGRPRTFVVNGKGRVGWVGGEELTQAGLTAAVDANR